jgi:hypothetical protein
LLLAAEARGPAIKRARLKTRLLLLLALAHAIRQEIQLPLGARLGGGFGDVRHCAGGGLVGPDEGVCGRRVGGRQTRRVEGVGLSTLPHWITFNRLS